mmetsp:Transcript_21360/g.19431  ORF Transcript_21360/g.19431 Transcript_21360/m.19431 type:complete len:816 (+) Transcript_21360:50-2497(+)
MTEQINNKKIEILQFPKGKSTSKDTEKYNTLFNAKDWRPNKGLSIISGVNGSGKSQLLKYIKITKSMSKKNKGHLVDSNEAFVGEINNGSLLYIPHNYQPNATTNNYKSSASLFIKEMKDQTFKNNVISEFISYYNKKRNILNSGNLMPASSDESILNKIMTILINENSNLDLADHNYIESKINQVALNLIRDIPFSSADLNCPLSPFINNFRSYLSLKRDIETYECNPDNLINDFLSKKSDEFDTNKIEIRSIFSKVNKSKYIQSCLVESWGSDKKPWDEVNTQLAKFPFFKHKIHYDEEFDVIYFTDNIKSPTYMTTFERLSSGEQMILTLLSWQYICRDYSTAELNSNNQKAKFQPDIILLDEPDKHFDPKLCKIFYTAIKDVFVNELNAQVIMTTHKIDTIALSNENELFTITKDVNNNIEIVATHKLLALFRLTGNLREITNYHLVVYAESRVDALFYEGVYTTLMSQSDELRRHKRSCKWQKEGSIFDIIFSRRIRFSFMSVSDEKDGGGGCNKVIDSIAKDITGLKLKNKLKCPLYDDIELSGPYGIIDNDYDKKHDFFKINTAEENNIMNESQSQRVVVLYRHSLENYICDPFILCPFIDTLNNISDGSNRFVKRKDSIIEILTNINNDVIEKKYSNIQGHLNDYFKFIFMAPNLEKVLTGNNKTGKSYDDKESNTYTMINNFKNNSSDLFTNIENVNINIDDEYIIEVMYPKEFFNVHGHSLANALFGGDKEAKKIVRIIAEEIFSSGIKFIPVDLIEIYCKLTHNVRNNIRKIIKPDKEKSYWSTKTKINLIQDNSENNNSSNSI